MQISSAFYVKQAITHSFHLLWETTTAYRYKELIILHR